MRQLCKKVLEVTFKRILPCTELLCDLASSLNHPSRPVDGISWRGIVTQPKKSSWKEVKIIFLRTIYIYTINTRWYCRVQSGRKWHLSQFFRANTAVFRNYIQLLKETTNECYLPKLQGLYSNLLMKIKNFIMAGVPPVIMSPSRTRKASHFP